ncbi:MAG: SpoIIE family protein phosphatase [Verrucomicrobiota bacterium]
MLYVLLTLLGIGVCFLWVLYRRERRRARDFDEEKQLVEQEREMVLDFMHNMVEAVGEGATKQELFDRIVHAAILSTGALSACIFERRENGKLRGVAVEGLFPPHRALPAAEKMKLNTRARYIQEVLKSEELTVGEGIIGAVAASGRGELITDATRDERVPRHEDPSLVIRSMVVAPIRFREKLLGVLAVANPADGMAFTKTDFSLIDSLAEQAALAIHNQSTMAIQIEKNKLDVDISLASNIQGLLLPKKFPQIPQLDMAATYLPAQKVGGDLYDVFELENNRLGIAIADVSGKGIPGSLLMAIAQTNLRHYARIHPSPSRVLAAMNKAMTSGMRNDMFLTIIYCVIDLENDEITLARAGHELPLVIRKSSDPRNVQADRIRPEGMALGMVPDIIFDEAIEDKTVPFRQGETLVLYTDGITETANEEGTEYSLDRLADALYSLRDKSAADMNAGVLSNIQKFAGPNGSFDDVTIMTVKHM